MKSALSKLVCSRTRAEIFRLLFGVNASEYHLRDMARQSGLAVGTMRQDLRKLVDMDIIISRRDGNRLYYRANRTHPLYLDIHNLTLKTAGLVEVLRVALGKKEVRVAFVFGSIPAEQTTANSDIDLMIIGDVGLRTVSQWLSGTMESLGREVNPHILSPSEFAERKKSREHFLANVLSSPRLFVIGGANELEELGGCRLVETA